MNILTQAGLWIDHREAFLVLISPGGTTTRHIQSDVEGQPRRAGEPPTGRFESQAAPADDSRQRQYYGHLVRYYDEIITALEGTSAVLILGPGEAKGELKARLNHSRPDPRPITMETADRLTEPELRAKVGHHFRHDPARVTL